MIEFTRITRLTFGISFIVLAVSSICWFFSPTYQTYIAGFMLGTLFSIFNGIILAVKTVKISEFALGQTKKRQGIGTLQRFLLAGFAGYVAVKYPAYFHWGGVIVGLSVVTIVSALIALFHHLRNLRTERGER